MRRYPFGTNERQTKSSATTFAACQANGGRYIGDSRYFAAEGVRDLDFLLTKARITIESVDETQARLARQGFYRFGKGRHPAALNFGDCFSYALAKSRVEPLLFKGGDFSLSDVDCHPSSE